MSRAGYEKLKKTAGFTLAEMLLTVGLIGLLITVLGGGLTTVLRSYRSTVRAENAQVLCSTIVSRIETELRGATEAVSDAGELKCFVSHSDTAYDGMRIGFTVEDGKIYVVRYEKVTDSSGNSVYTRTADEAEELLPAGTYTSDDFQAEVTLAAPDPVKLVTVTVSVLYDGRVIADNLSDEDDAGSSLKIAVNAGV